MASTLDDSGHPFRGRVVCEKCELIREALDLKQISRFVKVSVEREVDALLDTCLCRSSGLIPAVLNWWHS